MDKKVMFGWLRRLDGTSEFEEYIDELPCKDVAKLLAVISNTEEHGLLTAIKMQWIKKLEDDLYELRSKQGSDIQRALYFHKADSEYLITHGFTKKSPKTPENEIIHAKELRRMYKEGKLK
ncbi:MAG: type II toxin-antitoxin system RelE/ParE family toxin [Clostridiales Family XIII bacterium]|jgi:phage-related protein|nr:type II toxin-antitoxin system RelE/ParE family toxin [Clostridiales Family XIII bacterium]